MKYTIEIEMRDRFTGKKLPRKQIKAMMDIFSKSPERWEAERYVAQKINESYYKWTEAKIAVKKLYDH